jgi:hypothetical protein
MNNGILNQKSTFAPLLINKNDLFNLISIEEPYFALRNIFIDDKNFASAELPIEQPIGSEIAPISMAEATRHLATLGSVCCAYANPLKKKHYYLPHAGLYKRVSTNTNFGNVASLNANAICTYVDKKKAVAKTQLVDAKNEVIFEGEIFYYVVAEASFERLFSPYHVKSPDFSIENPYKLKNELFDIRLTTTNLTASLGKLPENYCSGHFSEFPTLPLSTLIYNLLDLAGLFIYHSTRDYRLKFMVKDLSVTADSLAFTGEKVDLEIKHMHSFDNLFVLSCLASANGSKSVADIKVTIEGIK